MRGAHWSELPTDVLAILHRGAVLPAHPLALDEKRQFDRVSQRALSRYYIDAGSGGLAVGVHATQFEIRNVELYRPLLELAAETAQSWTKHPLVMIAGVIGKTSQARQRMIEDMIVRKLGSDTQSRPAVLLPTFLAGYPPAAAALARQRPRRRIPHGDHPRRRSPLALELCPPFPDRRRHHRRSSSKASATARSAQPKSP